jgi:hypothetical protein
MKGRVGPFLLSPGRMADKVDERRKPFGAFQVRKAKRLLRYRPDVAPNPWEFYQPPTLSAPLRSPLSSGTWTP